MTFEQQIAGLVGRTHMWLKGKVSSPSNINLIKSSLRFNQDKASTPSMSGPGIRGKCLKIQFFLKRKPGMSPEEFHQYWEGDHALFALKIPGFKNVAASYTQVSYQTHADYMIILTFASSIPLLNSWKRLLYSACQP